jgi:hypothetical protein
MPPRRSDIEHIRIGPVVKQIAREETRRARDYVEAVRHTRGRRLLAGVGGVPGGIGVPGRAHFVTAEEAARLREHDDVLTPESVRDAEFT